MFDFFYPLYIYITGANPPVIRAGLMGMILIICILSRLKLPSLYVFSIVFITYLIYSPHSLLHVGFQLSFIITAALLLSLSLMKGVSSIWALNIIVTTISSLASLFVLPLHFYTFSTIGWMANLLFVPYFTLILLPLSFVLFILLFVQPTWFFYLDSITSFFLTVCENILGHLSSLPYSFLHIGKFNFMHWLLFSILTLLLFYFWQNKKKITFLFICWLVFLTFNFYPLNGYVTMLDVGQGDAFVIREPFSLGATVIDTGGVLMFNEEEWKKKDSEYSTGYDILLPYLRGIGAQHIDQLVLTHSDADHMQGALKLIQFIKVKKIVIAYPSLEDELMQELLAEANLRGIPIHTVKQGDELLVSKRTKLKVLHPSDVMYQSSNNGSIVLYGKIGGLRWLFTGDIEEAAEKDLLVNYPYLETDVLKVSHHGSNTSTKTTFLKQVSPKVAVISAGRNNRYGHPHKEVLHALASSRVRIYRTDLHGAVTYRYNFLEPGTFWTFYPYHETITE
ncbi:DNA internalization-related competence protein ComEC/Rec2 [Mangrovibacillus cuniculi]|uniref:DNA internalization-related competence protein ComEC/Rec2 n=1 Tax=Mangrovibacillus cuniculi TaxID=2593652 RepID=A0A7S8CBW4_9BACI|nr:DNA internalization-related competence protein ComEC/Rec2 [Mangrovibacillus cuniculi]QPC46948.1 DNA internalization-related competence protein ComEC/Rec2 [Mangrovibacillus cuniculi]